MCTALTVLLSTSLGQGKKSTVPFASDDIAFFFFFFFFGKYDFAPLVLNHVEILIEQARSGHLHMCDLLFTSKAFRSAKSLGGREGTEP